MSPNYSNSPLVTGSLAEDEDDVLVLQKFYDKLERLEEHNRSLHTEIGVVRSRNDQLTGEHHRVNRILLDMESKFSRESQVREVLEQELFLMKKSLLSERRLHSTEKTRLQELLAEVREEKGRLAMSLEEAESRHSEIVMDMRHGVEIEILEAKYRCESRLSENQRSLIEARDTILSQQADLTQKKEELSSLQKDLSRLRVRCSELKEERHLHDTFMQTQLSESLLEVNRQTRLFESEGVARETVFAEVGALRKKVQFLKGLLDRKDREIADKDKEFAGTDLRLKEAMQVIREVRKRHNELVGSVKVFRDRLTKTLDRASEQLGYLKECDSDDLEIERQRVRSLETLEGAINECNELPCECWNLQLLRILPEEDFLLGQD